MKPHKHAELIKAWADGAEIEVLDRGDGDWYVDEHPDWLDCDSYRIKVERNPDYSRYLVGERTSNDWYEFSALQLYGKGIVKPQIKITFDGETGELKTAEVLK